MLWTWIIPFLDIEGRYYASPDLVKSNVVPRVKTFNEENIAEYLQDMASVGLIILYDVENEQYLQFRKFNVFQSLRKDKEGKPLPAPPPDSRTTHGPLPDKDGTTPDKEKLSKEKLSKGNARTEESSPPVDNSKPPLEEKPKITPVPKSRHHQKETTEAEKRELQELIQQVAELYPYDRYKFNPLLWIQNHISAHPQAVIQTFRRLIEESEKGTKITIVRAYADTVVEEITKTMNANDVAIEAQGHKGPATPKGMAAMSQIMAGMGRPSP